MTMKNIMNQFDVYKQTHVSIKTCSCATLWDVETFAHGCDKIGKWPGGPPTKRDYLLSWDSHQKSGQWMQESNTAKHCCCTNHGIPGKGDTI